MSDKKTLEEKLHEVLQDLGAHEFVSVWNEYCDANNYVDDRLYSMSEFDEQFQNSTPLEIIKALGENFDVDDDWFAYTIYGVDSSGDPFDLVCEDDLINSIVREQKSFGCREIQDVLDEYDDEDEDEDDDED